MPAVTGNNFYIDSHDLHFRTGTTNVATINYDTSDESISLNVAGTGAINIGDAGGNLFIGDGTSETDIVFEQNGAIRGLTNKTLTLGQTDSNVTIAAQNFTISGTSVITDMSGRLQVQTIEATDNTAAGWAGADKQHGTIYMSDEGRGLLGNMGGGYARPLISSSSNAITIGSNGTSAIRDINIHAGNGAGSAMSNFNVFTSGVKRMTITRTGTMGFGGSRGETPYQAFVFDADGDRMDLLDGAFKIRDTNNNNAIQIQASVGNEARILASDFDTSTPHPLKIAGDQIRFTTSGNSPTNEVMILKADGNVGIGTDTPDEKLEVYSGHVLVQSSPVGGVTPPSLKIGQVNNAFQAGLISTTHVTLKSTNSAGEIIFAPGNTYRGMIKPDGKMGVNTIVPSGTLHVNGSGLFEDHVMIGADSVPTATKLNIGDGHVRLSDGYKIDWGGTNVRIDGNNASDYFRIFTSGTEKLRVDQAGNVGIGTNSPHTNQQLHIYGAGAGLEFSVDAQYADATRILSYDRNSSAYKPFYLQSSELRIDTNGSRRMTINSAGKVGINETNIDAYLHLSNSAEISQKFERPGASAWRIGIPNGQTYFAFDDTNDNLSSPKVVITKTDGNVGIGSNAPRQELDVSGVIAQSTTTVNSLPSATNNEGARSMVSDSQLSASSNFGATIAGYGGGSYTVPVWCDGAYWYIG